MFINERIILNDTVNDIDRPEGLANQVKNRIIIYIFEIRLKNCRFFVDDWM